jgi:hypothetical protein
MPKKQWSDLSPRTRRFIVVTGTVEAILKVVALVDLVRRPADQVRGRKGVWGVAIGVTNSLGAVPLAYLLWGRRRR